MRPLPNVWLGVSVEDQETANLRIPALLDTPAAVRWLSCEPLLGLISLPGLFPSDSEVLSPLGSPRRPTVDWVVVGGESGPCARPMHPEWARNLRHQCQSAGVPFLFKQWGEWNSTLRLRVGKKAAGRELDGRTWDEYPGGAA